MSNKQQITISEKLIDTLFALADEHPEDNIIGIDFSYVPQPTNPFDTTWEQLINGFFVGMKTRFTREKHVKPTVCITGSRGITLLKACPLNWIGTSEISEKENGIIGTFKEIPVFHHVRVDELESQAKSEKQAWFLMAYLPSDTSEANQEKLVAKGVITLQ